MHLAEAGRQHVKPLPDLWHGIIFYTTGELVKRELHKEKDASYQPYVYRFGIYDRGMKAIRPGLERTGSLIWMARWIFPTL